VQGVLKSAIANAEQASADVSRLVVVESRVDEGPTIKRFQQKDRGRAHPIMKRTSHIIVAVDIK
jgi:large subunit ribosomal protein L22